MGTLGYVKCFVRLGLGPADLTLKDQQCRNKSQTGANQTRFRQADVEKLKMEQVCVFTGFEVNLLFDTMRDLGQ